MSAQVVYRRAATRWLARLLVEGRRATIPRSRFASTRRAFVHIVDEAGTPASATCRQRTAPRGRRRRHRLTPDNQRALATGNLGVVRAAAAELPRIGVAEAASILLVIVRAEPEQYDRAAVRWLGRLCLERTRVDLADLSRAAAALVALPERPESARPLLAEVCSRAGQEQAAAVFRP
jgi:hypothetical protein